jgi:hypothetical protein
VVFASHLTHISRGTEENIGSLIALRCLILVHLEWK